MLDESTLPSARDPGNALGAVVALKQLTARFERNAVKQALAQGWTYAEIAEALGITKQAVHKKYAKLCKQ